MRRRLLPLLILALSVPAAAQSPEPPPADARAIDREIERLRAELVDLGRAGQQGEGLALEQRAKLAELNTREAALRTRIEANRDDLARMLGALQTYQRRPPPPLLVNPRSAKDAVRAAILIRAVAPQLEARGKAFAAQADAIAAIRRNAATASETLFQVESDVADRRARIDRLLAQKRALEQRLYSDTGEPDAAARALAARAGSVEEFVQGLAQDEGPAPVPAQAPSRLFVPVQGAVVRRFGDAGDARGRSEGWTWRTAPGASVLSPAAGRVDYAGDLKGWGQVLILNVGGDRRLVLAGLEQVSIGVGRAVVAGEPVGRLPAALPRGEAPELYLEVRSRSGALDPGRWLANAQNQSTNGVRR